MTGAEDEITAGDRLKLAMDAFATEFVIQVSTQGSFAAVDRSMALGYANDEKVGRHIAELIHPDDLPRVYSVIEEARATEDYRSRFPIRARHKDGTWHDLDVTVVDAHSRDPLVPGVLIRVRDLTAAEELDLELDEHPDGGARSRERADVEVPTAGSHAEANRFLSLAEALPLGILSADARSYVVFANEAACGLFQRKVDDLSGSGWLEAVRLSDRDEVRRILQLAMDSGSSQKVMFEIPVEPPRVAQARFLPLGDGVRTGWIATVEDITERLAFQSDLAHQATHDVLTELPNRSLLEDRLEQAVNRVQRHGISLAVLFVDLDEFKSINDDHGHAVGDEVIVEVADRLRSIVRDVDTIARFGGDEFVIVCEGTDPESARDLASRLEESIRQPMHLGDLTLRIGASIGVATTADLDVASGEELEVGDLLRLADRAMYEVKRRHRTAREG